MTNIIEQFLIVFIIVYCLNKIFIYFKRKSKKFKKVLSSEILMLVKLYGIDINRIGLKKVENDTALVNSIIITTDLLIYYNVKDLLYSILLIFVITFVLIFVLYRILARIYLKNM